MSEQTNGGIQEADPHYAAMDAEITHVVAQLPATAETEDETAASYAHRYAEGSKEFYAVAIDAVKAKQREVAELVEAFNAKADKRVERWRREGEEFADECRRTLGKLTSLIEGLDK